MCKTNTVPCGQETKKKTLDLSSLRSALPKNVFEKSIIRSMSYLFFDAFMIVGSTMVMYAFSNCAIWSSMSLVTRALISVAFWNFAGFFMWSLFVVGHDCGHGTFSNYEWFNDLIGHICHASILVPYYPWRMTHHRHHMYHNHEHKDYSHPWHTPEYYDRPGNEIPRLFNNPILRATMPLYGWFLYLVGMPDGNHFIPFPSDRMWKESASSESIRCVFSTATVIVAQYAIWSMFSWSVSDVMFYYAVPLAIFGWWLVTVTYLQHHTPNTKVFNDSNWTFVEAAFETVDRVYGFGIDSLSHHITDGHVVHHLFFTKIAHYNLPAATEALQNHLAENGLTEKYYRQEDTRDFFFRVFEYFYRFGFVFEEEEKIIALREKKSN